MNEKRAMIVTLAALVLIVIGIGASVYHFHFTVLVQLRQDLEQAKGATRDAQAKKDKIPGLQADIEKLKVREAALIKHIPDLTRVEYDKFANLLDGMRRRAGVIVDTARWVTPQRKQPVAGLQSKNVPATVHKVQFDLNVEGSFYQLLRFVNLVEQESRFINVETFTLTKSSESELGPVRGAPKRNMKVTIYSYTYKTPATATPISETPEPQFGQSTPVPD